VATALDRLLADGFEPVGAGPVQGNGAALDLPLAAPTDDVVVLVRATKLHDAGAATVTTEQLLLAQSLVLVRPDPAPQLQLVWVQPQAEAVPALRVLGGQPGVAYHFRPPDAGRAPVWPAYVHQRDERDPVLNKGLGQLALGIDFVVATDLDNDPAAAALSPGADPVDPLALDRRPPAAPLLDMPPLPADTLLTVRAVKVHTGIDQVLRQAARLPSMPVLRVEPEWPAPGQRAQVRVAASEAGTSYQLWAQGRPLADPQPGTGGPLLLATGILTEDSQLWLRSLREPGDGVLPMQREQGIDLPLLPRTDGLLAARRSPVAAGEATVIQLDRSQPGVVYQLQVGGRPSGDPVAGDGSAIEWPTGPIQAEARFGVMARRSDGRGPAVVLGEVLVTVLAAAPVAAPPPAPVASPTTAPPAEPPI
jgi:hypothetical protein